MRQVSFHGEFRLIGLSRDQMPTVAEAIMEEMLKLEESGTGLFDSAVSVDVGKFLVEIETIASATDFDVATAIIRSSVRSAFHATGGHTAGWDDVVIEQQRDNMKLLSA
ncbi:hypothetical protein EH165_12770 [Nakamurella antarctica]|uniref:Uncharacterized protein n=1 Tax=Nakamurella antarctica TaxID=1902245 RepID=A0A3G8ZNH4_9ACTN|nr:hypothetical protein [Nakamurella antarctica]AZI58882.1 hypothetical protein EH165_12770 [Nakamurella antarctica]